MAMAVSKFMLILVLVFFLNVPCGAPLQFDLSTIGPKDSGFINVAGSAYITAEGIQVTTNERNTPLGDRIGRATYYKPLYLWNKSSGNLTDFSTDFSFVIDSDDPNCHADGLAFFLAPVDSRIPANSSGSGLGLHNNLTANLSGDPFVAVEFDTYPNQWDPQNQGFVGEHVGIDINSLRSVTTKPWWNDVTESRVNHAWIYYDSGAINLTVVFTDYWDNQTRNHSITYAVDLRQFLPEWVTFGFSAATGSCFERHSVKSWRFNSSLQDTILQPNITSTPDSKTPNNQDAKPPSIQSSQTGRRTGKKLKTGTVVGIVVCLLVMIFLLALLGTVIMRKGRSKEDKSVELQLDMTMDNEFEMGSGAKKFSHNELTQATNNFAEEQKLGEGGFGSVFKGFLKDTNAYIAVKRVSRGSKQGVKEYASEVKIISQLRHRNLVQLVGWCHEKGELLLVYEFMPNGSLDSHLFKEISLLSWEARYKIARGLAAALLYLHEEWEQCIVHRDIKSSNIMLDSGFNAKLGDFGLARLVDHEKEAQTTLLAGTMGYMAPECAITGKASKESDVFSFGIVALEIACGRKSIDLRAKENQIALVQWIWDLYGTGRLLEGADTKLQFDEEQIKHLMIVGLWCAHPDSSRRPSIRQATHVLDFEAQLPILPSKMPLPIYPTPEVNMQSHYDNVYGSIALQSSNYSSKTESSGLTASSKSASSST